MFKQTLASFLAALCLALSANGQLYEWTVFAGKPITRGEAGAADSSLKLEDPEFVATDAVGNVYVGDQYSIYKINPAGAATPFPAAGDSKALRFVNPRGIVEDAAGNLYVVETGSRLVRKVTPAGVVTTVVNNTTPSREDRAAKVERLQSPVGAAVDKTGHVYVADLSAIRRISPTGQVVTIAGLSGQLGNLDGPMSDARFKGPQALAFGPDGSLYIADSQNNVIRVLKADRIVSTFAGQTGKRGSADGNRGEATFNNPCGIAVDRHGTIYVADGENCTIRKITKEGVVSTLAGTPGRKGYENGAGKDALFSSPSSVAVDASGQVYVADRFNRAVRKITAEGVVSTFAGAFPSKGSTDAVGEVAKFSSPHGIVIGADGNIYVADTGNHAIRKITPAGIVTTFAGTEGLKRSEDNAINMAGFAGPHGLAVDAAGTMYVTDTVDRIIRKITSAGVVSTLAGNPTDHTKSTEAGAAARFRTPVGIAVNAAGTVYVTDTNQFLLHQITPAGVVTSIAGAPGPRKDGQDVPSWLGAPTGLTLDAAGNIYVGEEIGCVFKVTPEGAVTKIVGKPIVNPRVGTTDTRVPGNGVTIDGAGNLYVAGGTDVHKITPTGIVTKIGGLKRPRNPGVDPGAEAYFSSLGGIAISSTGVLYVTDTKNNCVYRGIPVPP